MKLKANDWVCLAAFMLICIVKIVVLSAFILLGSDLFGGGNDSDYYDAYARGLDDVAVNVWPSLLRSLNYLGLYSRDGVTAFLIFVGLFLIPFQVAALSFGNRVASGRLYFWLCIYLICAYPTLTYLTTDIYRDAFMVSVWLVGLLILKKLIAEPATNILNVCYLFLAIIFVFFLYGLRPYLGLGYALAMVFSRFYSFKKFPFWLTLFACLLLIFIFFLFGVLEPLIRYRTMFLDGSMDGGSNLGIPFSEPSQFFYDFFRSLFYQLFGFFFVNKFSVFVFIVESVPFMSALIYVVRNRRYSNKFVDILLVFFFAYTVVWLLGNDNLGTAVRLRIFSYLSVLIAFFVIHKNKLAALATNTCLAGKF